MRVHEYCSGCVQSKPRTVYTVHEYCSGCVQTKPRTVYTVHEYCLGCVQSKPRTVYVYMKEKQVVVKEYILKFIPRKIISFRVNPKVRVNYNLCVL